MKVLIAILSCLAHRDRQRAQRDTWLKDLSLLRSDFAVEHRFFLGKPVDQPEDDEVVLDVDDSFQPAANGFLVNKDGQGLAHKTRAMCRWALGRDFDFTYKADTDTLVNPWGLMSSGFQNCDYMGGSNAAPAFPGSDDIVPFASGGAGYWLSKRALAIVANSEIRTDAEDVFVAVALRDVGISPVWHSGYRWFPGDVADKNMVSLHFSSALKPVRKHEPAAMYGYYRRIKELEGK